MWSDQRDGHSEVRMVVFDMEARRLWDIVSVWSTHRHKIPQSLEDVGSLPTSWLTF